MPTTDPSTPQFALQPGERQLWVGQPAQGMLLNPPKRSNVAQILGATIFGIFFASLKFLNTLPLSLPLLLLAALFGGTFGYVFFDARRRTRTTYVLTDRRAIISQGDVVQSYPFEQLRDARVVENADGTHNLEWPEGKFIRLRSGLEPYDALRSLTASVR